MSDHKQFNSSSNKSNKVVDCYKYENENGDLVFEKERLEPKSFRFKRMEGGRAAYNLKGITPIPYRLPKWKDSSSVIICEGEKDADALADLGFASTSGPYGASSWPEELTRWFEGKLVYIAYDIGEEDNAEKVAASLWGTASEIKICSLPSEQYEFDICDFLNWYSDRPKKITAIRKLLRASELYMPPDLRAIHELQQKPKHQKRLEVDNSFLNLWTDSISRVTDAPYIFILFSGLGILSGLLNSHWFSYPRRTQLNLYFLLLAPSTICRKSVVLDIVNDYLAEIDPEVIFPESFTPEAFLSYLTTNCCGLILWRELIQVGGFAFGSEYNKALPSLLTDLYDAKSRFRRVTRGEDPFDVSFPSISILAAGIQSWLISMMTGRENDFYGGLWTRFLMVSAPDEKERPFRLPGRFLLNSEILKRLRSIYGLEPKEIRLEPILSHLESWGTEHQRQSLAIERPEMQACFQRLEVATIKIAALLQLADMPESTAIEPEAFIQAVKIVEYLKADLPGFFEKHVQFTYFDKAKARTLGLIQSNSPISRGDILRLAHLKSDFLDKVLRQLQDEGRIKEIPLPSTEKGGRPGKAYEHV